MNEPMVRFRYGRCQNCGMEWEFTRLDPDDAEQAGALGLGLLQPASVWRRLAEITPHTPVNSTCNGAVMFALADREAERREEMIDDQYQAARE